MTGVTDIVDLIDNAIDGWHGSADAMRWTPAPVEWDEPIVRSPRGADEHLTAIGWDGYAARAYPAVALRIAWRNVGPAFERFGRQMMKLVPGAVNATEAIQKLLAAQRDLEPKTKPAPFWAVQPQCERRR